MVQYACVSIRLAPKPYWKGFLRLSKDVDRTQCYHYDGRRIQARHAPFTKSCRKASGKKIADLKTTRLCSSVNASIGISEERLRE
jgi:hypothetical protein